MGIKSKQSKAPVIDVTVVQKQQLIFNPKVEQVVRAMYFGFENEQTLQVSPVKGTAIAFFNPDEYVVIGIADERGYRFTPQSNSALIALGYHPKAVLLWLTQLRLNGLPVVQVQDDKLIALHSAVVNCARDVVFNYEVLSMVKGRPRVIARPILANYRRNSNPLFS